MQVKGKLRACNRGCIQIGRAAAQLIYDDIVKAQRHRYKILRDSLSRHESLVKVEQVKNYIGANLGIGLQDRSLRLVTCAVYIPSCRFHSGKGRGEDPCNYFASGSTKTFSHLDSGKIDLTTAT